MNEELLLVLGIGLFSFTPLSPLVTIVLLKSGGNQALLKHLLGRLTFYTLLTLILLLFESFTTVDILLKMKVIFAGKTANYIVFGVLTLIMIKVLISSFKGNGDEVLKSLQLDTKAYWSGIVFSAIQPRIILLYLYGILDLANIELIYHPVNALIVFVIFLCVIWHQIVVWVMQKSVKVGENSFLKRKQNAMMKNWKLIIIVFYVAISCLLLF